MVAAARSLDWQFQLLDLKPGRPTPTLVPPPPAVEPGESPALRQLRAALNPSIAAKVRSGAELLRHVFNSDRAPVIPTTLEPLDALLGGGLQRGKLIELVSRRAAGRYSIVLSALAAATTMGEAVALIDLGDHFDPQLAAANGVDLRRLLWVRPRSVKEAVMSAEMITATGFQLVVVDTGLHPVRGRRAPEAAWVRLARTAETCGTAMLVSSPYPLTATASEAVLKAHVARAKWIGKSPRLLESMEMTITLEKHRHMKPGSSGSVILKVAESDLECGGRATALTRGGIAAAIESGSSAAAVQSSRSVAGSHPAVSNPATQQLSNPATR